MNFMLEWQELYLRVNAPREHKIHIFELTCNVNVLMTPFLTIFRRFSTTFRRFPKILQNCSEGQTNVSEHFSNDSEHFPKITEADRRRSEDVSIVQQQILV